MNRKLTISIGAVVYRGLHPLMGRSSIGKFMENLARPDVCDDALAAGYRHLANDERREREADEWTEAHFPAIDDEAW